MKNSIHIIGYIVAIVLTIVIVKNLGFAGGIDAENKIKALTHQIDSLQSHVDSNNVKIAQLDSLTTLYKTKVDVYKNKYNEEHNRITNLDNASVVSEFTDAFD